MNKLLSKIGTFGFLISTMFICTACPPDPDEDTTTSSSALTVAPSELSLASNAGAQGTFSIASTSNWEVSCGESWVSLSQINGSGAGAITVTAASENPNSTERTATITVKSGTESKYVTVKQAATDVLTLSGLDATFEASAGSIQTAQELTITCNGSWTIEGKPDWLEVSALSGTGNSTVKVWPNSANTDTKDREARLTVKSGSKSETKTVKQRAGYSDCWARPTNITVMTNSLVYGYEFSNNMHRVYFNLFSRIEANGYTDSDIIANLRNYTDQWTTRTPEQFKANGNFYAWTGIQPNYDYVLVSVAVDGSNQIGEINRQSFTTKKDDTYNSPYIDPSNVTVAYDEPNGQIVYRIRASKDAEHSGYASKFYSWAAAGTSNFQTLNYHQEQVDAILAYLISLEIKKNPEPHDTYINGSDRNAVRERLEGPMDEANYTIPANYGNDKYVHVINWCTLSSGEFSGKITSSKYTITSNARFKVKAVERKPSNKVRVVQFNPEKIQKELKIIKLY